MQLGVENIERNMKQTIETDRKQTIETNTFKQQTNKQQAI